MDAATIKRKLKNIPQYRGFIFAKDIDRSLKDGYYAVNLDRSRQLSGTHWVGLAVTLKNIYYFDSFGGPPPEEIVKLKSSFMIAYSSNQLQKPTDTNCGEWIIKFIKHMSKNDNNFKSFIYNELR